MYCRQCGALLTPGATFCGNCGTRAEPEHDARYLVCRYDAEYAKRHHASFHFGALVARGLTYCLAPMLLLFIDIRLISVTLGLCFLGIAGLVTESILARKYLMARQSALVRDQSWGRTYYITLIGSPSVGFDTVTHAAAAAQNLANARQAAAAAQAEAVLIQELERYLAGERTYNVWTGGPVRVLALGDPQLVREGRRVSVYRYHTPEGRERTIRIPNAFPTIKEVLP